MKFYEALGLEPSLAVEPDDLKKRFYERSREWHPDRFSRATPAEQQKALDMTALLNDAFRTLRDPVKRAEYFLQEKGVQLSKEVPPELLEEVFELNMALEELRGGDASARPQLESARDKFAAMRTEIDYDLAAQAILTILDPASYDQVRSLLNRRRYISNLLREVEKELNVQLPN